MGERTDSRGALSRYHKLFDILAVVFLLWLFAWTLAKIETPLSPSPLPGERWGVMSGADFLTMLGGERFYEEGFANHYFLSNMTVGYKEFARGWYYYQVPQIVPNSAIYYTHYGSLDSIINGLLRYLGITDLKTFYKIAAFLSVLSLGLWYALASMLFNRTVAFISLLFMGTSLIFLRLMETITGYSYDLFLTFGAVFLFLLAERKAKGAVWRNIGYGCAWLLVFLQASNSYDSIIWLQLFFIGYLWISRGRFLKKWRLMLLMVCAPVAAVSLHFLQVAWCLGGLHNAFIDFSAAFARRTTEFALAVEVPFKEFQLGQVPLFIEGELWKQVHMEFIGMGILLCLTLWIYRRLRPSLAENEAKRLWIQWKLLPVFFLGAFIFWAILIQYTVTTTNVTFRLILPFTGLLIGYLVVMVTRYLLQHQEGWWLKALIAVALLVVIGPVIHDRASGAPFDINWHCQAPEYTGRTTNEIHILSGFVCQNSSYGDIVLTNINVGDTGHLRYPHPAYEYLSQRRIEVTKDIPEVIIAVNELEGIRQTLPLTNPASKVSFYLLVEEPSNKQQLGQFARYIGKLQDTLDTQAWWIEHRGGLGVDPRSGYGGWPERQMVFYLYKIGAAQVELGYKKLVDNLPTAPVVDVIPDSPRRGDNLVCRITTQSTDPDGDAISYRYAWYKDGVLQPGLTRDTVDSSNTKWGETWKCVVTPNDGLLDGPSGEDRVTLLDKPPTAPVVDVTPDSPRGSDNLVAKIATQSTDPDGDAITYSYAWYKNGVLQPGITTDTVDSSETKWGETWKCIVTPNDGFMDGPSGEDQVTVEIEKWIESFVKIPLKGSSIEVSSFGKPEENKESLLDGNTKTFWHVSYPPQTDNHWVLIDLGKATPIDGLRIKPRSKHVEQFWNSPNVVFQASSDKEAWTTLATLTVDRATLNNDNPQWITFGVKSGEGFRYYRLFIHDISFLSLAELELYRSPSLMK